MKLAGYSSVGVDLVVADLVAADLVVAVATTAERTPRRGMAAGGGSMLLAMNDGTYATSDACWHLCY